MAPPKKVPPVYIQKWLQEMEIKELAFWSDLYDKGGEFFFEKLINLRVEGIKNNIFRLPESSPTLAIDKALLRGGAQELVNMKLLVRYARREFEKRMNKED